MTGRLPLAVHGVSKYYGPVVALDDVTLDVKAGEIYALLGLNGAGKTTLIRILLGMVHPTSGRVELGHRSTADRSVWADVGYLVETAAAYPELTVVENLEVIRRLRRLRSRTAVDEAVELFGLGPLRQQTRPGVVARQRPASRSRQGHAAPACTAAAG